MTSTMSPHYFAYPSYNDIFALNNIMLQQPYSVSDHSTSPIWNQHASNHFGGPSNSNFDLYSQRNLTYSRKRKRPFTIRAILDLGNDDSDSSSGDYYENERAKILRLSSPEPIQMSSTRYLKSEETSHFAETVTSSDSYLPNEPVSCRMSSPCSDTQSAIYSCQTSEETSSSPNRKAKRIRTIFTQYQLEKLETEFLRTQYMVGSERVRLAAELCLTESQIKVWFQNRRIKLRKQDHEKQQAALAKLKENPSEDRQTETDVNHSSLSSSSISSSCSSSDESQL